MRRTCEKKEAQTQRGKKQNCKQRIRNTQEAKKEGEQRKQLIRCELHTLPNSDSATTSREKWDPLDKNKYENENRYKAN